MILPLLKRFVRLIVRVAVVEPADVTKRDAILVQVINEAAAIGLVIRRPAEAVHDLAGLRDARLDLPQLLDADRITLRITVAIEIVFADQSFAQMAARAFAEHGGLGADVDALRVAGLVRSVLGDAHVADAHAGDRAMLVEQHFRGGKARIDFHAQRFGLRRQPRAHRAQRDDEVAVVVHLRRQRQSARTGLAEQVELVRGDRHADRRRRLAPTRQQCIERPGLDHRAGQDMRADRRRFLDHADAEVGLELLEADRERQACRTGADRDHVVFHDIAFAHCPTLQRTNGDFRRLPGPEQSRKLDRRRRSPSSAIPFESD